MLACGGSAEQDESIYGSTSENSTPSTEAAPDPVCTADELRCSGNLLEQCIGSEGWVTVVDCGAPELCTLSPVAYCRPS